MDWLRKQLIGPAGLGRLSISPLERYPTGVLHPIEPGVSGTDPGSPESVADIDANLHDDDMDEDTVGGDAPETARAAHALRRRRYVPPSSAGMSFCIQGDAQLLITVSAARYERCREPRDAHGRFLPWEYERKPLDPFSITWKSGRQSSWDVWDGLGGIDVRARKHASGTILTVTLFNRNELEPDIVAGRRSPHRIEQSLFEAQIECAVETGHPVEYPRVDPSLLTEEERELELQYRNRRIYAVGHGAAVDWTVKPSGGTRIWTDFMPATEVPMVAVASHSEHRRALSMRLLAESTPFEALDDFVAGYREWIAGQQREADRLRDSIERGTGELMCGRMEETCKRMRRGVDLLRTDSRAEQSFRLANRAMLEQMRQKHLADGKEADPDNFLWRPFQLAFLLTAMESTVREADDFRDVLDLIWFPTGGGKTEANLGLIAILIVWRRLIYGSEGSGTVAFMRYTLRLLTRQQFERAAGVIFALELMRRKQPELLGEEPITIGIWVGGAISPNRYGQAMETVHDIGAGKQDAQQRLIVDRCLWCRAELDVMLGSYRAAHNAFQLHCPNRDCKFGGDPAPLPCNVVDDALYDRPPTLLIGTIDKFARLAWEPRAGAFFGSGGPGVKPARPPELVIQDELHLVTGPLGSVAGLYEAGLDALLSRLGTRPKYVASTATIRMAKDQVKRLYARDLAVFPPPGLSCDDSWFALTDNERAGRLYVGFLAPALDSQHCMAPLAAALLAAPEAVFDQGQRDREVLLDAWWTQVVYHGSLKGVGSSHNAFMTDVLDFGRRLYGEQVKHARSHSEGEGGDEIGGVGDGGGDWMDGQASVTGNGVPARFANCQIDQLTSLKTAQENSRTFHRLASGRGADDCLDAVLATNMVSVGLDVARLALMVVNGQPLTTAEYIQASSRVGRDEVPGLVFANYFRHQARSLSHYECFRSYHESFYRFVESTSVTPYTFQARSRALHAALVIALRHACSHLRDNRAAGQFDSGDQEVRAVVDALRRRCASAAGTERTEDSVAHIDELVAQWHDEARRCKVERRQLNYYAPDREKNAERLLCSHDSTSRGLWRTLNSMRNVESAAEFKVHD